MRIPFKNTSTIKKINPFPHVLSYFRSEIREEILKKVELALVYFDGQLIAVHERLRVENVAPQPQAIAQAAQQLQQKLKPGKKTKKSNIALFLPITEFVYTAYHLPAIDAKNVAAAIKYQQPELLPASEQALEVAVYHQPQQQENYALWYKSADLEQFYQVFLQQGLSLLAVLPEFALKADRHDGLLSVQTAQYFAQYQCQDKALSQIRHIMFCDYENKDFRQQWEKQFGEIDKVAVKTLQARDWYGDDVSYKESHYVFFPQAVSQRFKNSSRLKNSRVIGLLAFILILILAIPFVSNELRYYKYEQRYQQALEDAREVRMLRAKALEIEEQWALYLDYPKIHVLQLLQHLDRIIPKDSWISAFEIKDDYVEIEGYSPNPTKILEIISSQENFEQAAFNQNIRAERGRSKEKFGITFHLKGLDVQAYEEQYFKSD